MSAVRSWGRGIAVAVLLSTWTAGGLAAQAGEEPIAELGAGPAGVEWRPLVDAERLILTVTGPHRFQLRQELAAGTSPTFSLFDARGQRRPDGSYTWELRAVPRVRPRLRERLARARQSGDEALVESILRAAGLPLEPRVQSGTFAIRGGSFVLAGLDEEPGAPRPAARTGPDRVAPADQVVNDDLILNGSACVGADCAAGETFDLETLRLKDNNLRLHFEDTSAAGFPAGDWQIAVNDTASGGADRFSIADLSAGRTPFTVAAGAPDNALFTGASGHLGLGTATPARDLHAVSGNSPALRLEQDGTSGLGVQTWDVGGNEAGFFVRDVTAGNLLPLQVRPGAPSSSLDVRANGDVGIGTAAAAEKVHVFENLDAISMLVVENPHPGASAAGVLRARSDVAIVNFQAHGSGRTISRFGQTLGGWIEMIQSFGNGFIIGTTVNKPLILGTNSANRLHITDTGRVGIGTSAPASLLHVNGGDVRVSGGSFIDDGVTLNVPDYVFEPGYPLMPLAELRDFVAREKHLPNVPSAAEVKRDGLDVSRFQMRLLEKVEELTLYTLAQDGEIARLRAQNAALEAELQALNAALAARLAAVEQALGTGSR